MRLYHNPRCSKSRQALAILQATGLEFEDYRYLEKGIHAEDLAKISKLEGAIRKGDIDNDYQCDLSNSEEVMLLLQRFPKTLQRPILVSGQDLVIGRPPENISKYLESKK